MVVKLQIQINISLTGFSLAHIEAAPLSPDVDAGTQWESLSGQ